MKACIELLLVFARIGLFTFGGGYGMIPLIQQEVTSRGWLDAETLLQYIGICESTPGPIAVNMATFIGSSRAGLAGSACATLGVVLPSFVIILLIAAVLKQFRQNRYVAAALGGIKPVVAGMIASTGLCLALKCLVVRTSPLDALALDYRQLAIAAALGVGCFVWIRGLKRRFSPIALIAASALLGVLFYSA